MAFFWRHYNRKPWPTALEEPLTVLECRFLLLRANTTVLYFLLIAILLLQVFSWLCSRGLFWLLQGYLKPAARRKIRWLVFGIGNGLLLLSLLRVWPGVFRLSAGWMVLLWYGVLTVSAVWLLHLLLRRRIAPARLGSLLRPLAAALFMFLLGISVYNAYTPVVHHYRVAIDKPLPRPVRIGLASDTHLGVLFGARQLDRLSAIMQREQVDIILLPGDLMDDDTRAYRSENMQRHLQQLRAPLGVYATLGNHDLFGHQDAIRAELEAAGIQVLNDDVVRLDAGFWLVGRPDDLDRQRKSTAELLKLVDTREPVFLLDHRPTEIRLHQALPIDIQVSGHVHKGQVFPSNFIVDWIYDLSYGYQQRGLGHYFVTSGYGFWGVPFRLGSQSEVMIIDVVGRY